MFLASKYQDGNSCLSNTTSAIAFKTQAHVDHGGSAHVLLSRENGRNGKAHGVLSNHSSAYRHTLERAGGTMDTWRVLQAPVVCTDKFAFPCSHSLTRRHAKLHIHNTRGFCFRRIDFIPFVPRCSGYQCKNISLSDPHMCPY